MKSSNLLGKILCGLIILIVAASCFRERDRTYQGPAKAAWYNPHEDSPLLIKADTTIVLTAEIIGHQQSEDQTFDVSVVDTVNADAEEGGKPYALSSESVTIPADSSSAEFSVDIIAHNVQKGEQVPVLIKLKGNDKIKADPNIGINRITIASNK
jgi:alpha-glucosidase (family GH31 glycosyl hydrolase)